MDIKNRIAALESMWITKTGSCNIITNLLAGWFILVLLVIAGLIMRRVAVEASTPVVFPISIVILLLFGVWLWEYLLSCLAVKITGTEITVQGLFGRKCIQWSTVTEAYTAFGLLMPKHFLVAGDKRISFPTTGMKSIPQLEAAIYQHLESSISLDRVKLSKTGLSIFSRIPKYVPKEQEWYNPKSQNQAFLIFKIILMGGAFAVMVWWFRGGIFNLFILPMVWFTLADLYNWIKAGQSTARSVNLYRDGLIVTTSIKSVNMDWEDIVEAEWVNKTTIGIKDVDSDEVFIPVIESEPESCMLILGLLRGLRNHTNFALPIPDFALKGIPEYSEVR